MRATEIAAKPTAPFRKTRVDGSNCTKIE